MFKKASLDVVLEVIAKKYSDKTAIIFEDQKLSYRELYRLSSNLAASLHKLNIKKDDKIAILLPNSLEYLICYFACFILGAWAVPLSTRYESMELKNIIENSDANVIIYKDHINCFNYNQILGELKSKLPKLKHFIYSGSSELEDAVSLEQLIHSHTEKITLNNNIDPDDIALLAYTSGTTGDPKGVMIPHKNLVETSRISAELWDVQEEVAFSVAPLYAAQGFLAVLMDLVAGVTMKWISSFNPNDILKHLVKEEITAFHTQPTMWTLLLSLPAFNFLSFKHLNKVVVSGSLCSSELAKRIQNKTQSLLLNAYGLIEATGVVTITRLDDTEDIRLNTVGSPIPGVELKIVDENRDTLPPGKTGELAVKGYLMKGYYKKEEHTNEVIDEEGWLYTGDLACYHSDGKNIQIVGRKKDMVIRGGFNIYPIDIEEHLLTSPDIEDVSVVGIEDPILGERLVAFVIPNPSRSLTEAGVKKYCRGKIASYKIPDEVHLVSQFPILLSGKIQKNILREWANVGIPEKARLLFSKIKL